MPGPAMNAKRIDAITGLRGIAALLVVYGHSVDWFALSLRNHFFGEIGVAIFFSLSGFLMAYLYLERKFSALDVTEYAIARFSRIAPAYLFILLLSFFIYTSVDPGFVYDISSKNILRHLLFSGNVSVFWSITPEVEFYFLFVLAWAAASRYGIRREVAGLAFLAFASLILMSYRDFFPGTFVGAKLHYFLFGLIAGAIRAKVGEEAADRNAFAILHMLLIGLMLFGVSMILIGRGPAVLPFAGIPDFYGSILTAVSGAFVVFSLSFPSAPARFFFGNRFIVFCGECSFSIYLLHMPVIYVCHKFLRGPFHAIYLIPFLAVVLLLSWLNYRLVERPGARLIKSAGNLFKRRFAPLFPLPAGAQSFSAESDIR
jgi:peptidoglycan/LPS O-acetylase OafA/YrhL